MIGDNWEPQVICGKPIYEIRGLKNECQCEKCKQAKEEEEDDPEGKDFS
jgi:NAD-dependent SIR2 family protein deacetylase